MLTELNMDYREALKNKHRIVVKIGTSSLSYPNGRMNFHSIEKLAYVLSAVRRREYRLSWSLRELLAWVRAVWA